MRNGFRQLPKKEMEKRNSLIRHLKNLGIKEEMIGKRVGLSQARVGSILRGK